MYEYLPLLIAGAIIGTFALIFIVAYVWDRRKKQVYEGYERNMSDRELVRRLSAYAKPLLEAVSACILRHAGIHCL